jgi:hypothetical protein
VRHPLATYLATGQQMSRTETCCYCHRSFGLTELAAWEPPREHWVHLWCLLDYHGLELTFPDERRPWRVG